MPETNDNRELLPFANKCVDECCLIIGDSQRLKHKRISKYFRSHSFRLIANFCESTRGI